MAVYEIDVSWRIVIECWIIEWEIEDGWIAKSSRQNWMLVMHEGQCRLDMNSVVMVVVTATISSLVRGRSMVGGGWQKNKMRKRKNMFSKLPRSQGEVYCTFLNNRFNTSLAMSWVSRTKRATSEEGTHKERRGKSRE